MIRFGAMQSQFDNMMRTGLYLNGLIYLLFGALLWPLSPILAQMLRINTNDLHLVTALLGAFWIRDFGYCLQQTLYRTNKIFAIEAVYWLGSSLGFIYCAVNNTLTSGTVALLINLYAAIASSLMAIILGFGGVKLFRRIHLIDVRQLISYGIDTLGIGLANTMIYGMDVLLIGAIYTKKEVGIYNGAKAVWRILSSVNQAVGMLVLPYASRLKSELQTVKLRELFEKVTAYVWIGLISASLVGILLAELFYTFFLGGKYDGSVTPLRLMLIGAAFEGIYNIAGNILYGLGLAKEVAKISIRGAVILLLLLFPAIYYFQGIGAASALSATLVIIGIMMFFRTARELGTDFTSVKKRFIVNLSNLIKRS